MKNNIEDKIDFVVTFVDKSDPEYIERYNNFIKENEIPVPEINNLDIRATDYGTLQCLIRSVDLYLPWINNVYLVVQSESQVPKWINKSNVKIVLHEDFIPKEYLPTYNTFTIQTHLHLIPGLSEKFISSDDDSIILKPLTPEYFFIKNKVVQAVIPRDMNKTAGSNSKASHYFKMNSSEISKKLIGLKNDVYYQSDHSMHGMLKSINNEVYNLLDIKTYITSFRNPINIMRNTYFAYAYLTRRMIVVSKYKNYSMEFKNATINDFRMWINNRCICDQVSINDQVIPDNLDKNLYYKMVKETIFQLFPNKSKKYEI